MRPWLLAGRRGDRDARLPAKLLLTRLGATLGERTIYNLNGCFNYAYTGCGVR